MQSRYRVEKTLLCLLLCSILLRRERSLTNKPSPVLYVFRLLNGCVEADVDREWGSPFPQLISMRSGDFPSAASTYARRARDVSRIGYVIGPADSADAPRTPPVERVKLVAVRWGNRPSHGGIQSSGSDADVVESYLRLKRHTGPHIRSRSR